jgi:hypothetical protein
MKQNDFDQFGQMLDAVCSLLSRGAYQPSAANTAMWFRALARFDLADVRAAFDAHVADAQRGRFVPVPADLIAQLQGAAADDGRPGAEEAWALALTGADERTTVVWPQEVAQAWAICRPVWAIGDEVGARMAFREAYTRLVGEARAAGTPAQWQASLGHDPAQRAEALEHAAARGLLPAPERALLAGPPDAKPDPDGLRRVRELLVRLRERQAETSIDAAERQRTEELKREAAQRVADYTAGKTGA